MKSLSGAQDTLLQLGHLGVIAFAEFDFGAENVQRYCTASFTYVWNTFEWKGLGGLVSIEPFRETGAVEAVGLKASLAGFPTTLYPNPISTALNEHVQGRPCKIWIGFLDESWALVGTPVLEFQGRIDTLTIVEEGGTATMSVNMESRFADFFRPRVRRFTDADHRLESNGDKYFEYLPQMVDQVIVFPSKEAQRR